MYILSFINLRTKQGQTMYCYEKINLNSIGCSVTVFHLARTARIVPHRCMAITFNAYHHFIFLLQGARVWVRDPDLVWKGGELKKDYTNGDKLVDIELDDGGVSHL